MRSTECRLVPNVSALYAYHLLIISSTFVHSVFSNPASRQTENGTN